MSKIFHTCHCLNRSFSFKEWGEYCKGHHSSEIVFQFRDFGFNICDVCLTPHEKVKWQGANYNHFEIRTCQSPCGLWDYGLSYTFATNGHTHAAGFIAENSKRKGYATEKEAIYTALFELEKAIVIEISQMPDSEYDEEVDKIIDFAPRAANLRTALNQIAKFKDIYDPRQLNLFDL